MWLVYFIIFGLIASTSSSLAMYNGREESKVELSLITPARAQQPPIPPLRGTKPALSEYNEDDERAPLVGVVSPQPGFWNKLSTAICSFFHSAQADFRQPRRREIIDERGSLMQILKKELVLYKPGSSRIDKDSLNLLSSFLSTKDFLCFYNTNKQLRGILYGGSLDKALQVLAIREEVILLGLTPRRFTSMLAARYYLKNPHKVKAEGSDTVSREFSAVTQFMETAGYRVGKDIFTGLLPNVAGDTAEAQSKKRRVYNNIVAKAQEPDPTKRAEKLDACELISLIFHIPGHPLRAWLPSVTTEEAAGYAWEVAKEGRSAYALKRVDLSYGYDNPKKADIALYLLESFHQEGPFVLLVKTHTDQFMSQGNIASLESAEALITRAQSTKDPKVPITALLALSQAYRHLFQRDYRQETEGNRVKRNELLKKIERTALTLVDEELLRLGHLATIDNLREAAFVHNWIALNLTDEGEQAKYSRRATKLYDQCLKLLGDQATAADLNNAAFAHHEMAYHLTDKSEKAKHYVRAAELGEQHLKRLGDQATAADLNNAAFAHYGIAHHLTDKREKARHYGRSAELYEQCLKLLGDQAKVDDFGEVANAHWNTALNVTDNFLLHFFLGINEKARHYVRAAELLEKRLEFLRDQATADDFRDAAFAHYSAAGNITKYKKAKHYGKAIELYEKSLGLLGDQASAVDLLRAAYSYSWMADNLASSYDYDEEERIKHYVRAAELYEQRLKLLGDQATVADLLRAAYVHEQTANTLREREETAKHYGRAAELYEQRLKLLGDQATAADRNKAYYTRSNARYYFDLCTRQTSHAKIL